MYVLDKVIARTVVFIIILSQSLIATASYYQLGKPATAEEIQGWDIDIRADGFGLPDGRGTAIKGETLFIEQCASCHGEFAEGIGRYPALAGGEDSLDSDEPIKTVGSYWPYAPTIFDYVNRAMPFGNAQSLSPDEVYAITAYILYSNDLIEDDFELNQSTLAAIEMPNRYGFIQDNRSDELITQSCMTNCRATSPVVIGKASHIDVTPESTFEEIAQQHNIADPKRGEAIFTQCVACHSMTNGENQFGPHLHAIIGRKVGGLDSFTNYSDAMRSADYDWSVDNLREFLRAPQVFLPGTLMPFGGISDNAALEDLLAFFQVQITE